MFPLLAWAPFGMPLLGFGIREIVIFWAIPTLVVLVHLPWNSTLSDLERRQWRRSLLIGGWGVALIYLCSQDRHFPTAPREDA
jgi:hypothetical protein